MAIFNIGCIAAKGKVASPDPDIFSPSKTKDTSVGPQSGFVNVGNVDAKTSIVSLVIGALVLLYLERLRYSKKLKKIGELLVVDNFRQGLSEEDKKRIRSMSKVLGVDKDLRKMVDKNRPRP